MAQLFLLLLAFNAFVVGLGGLVRGAELSAFLPAAVPAVLLGWWLGQSRFSSWRFLSGAGLLGIGLLWGRTAQLGEPVLRMAMALPGMLFQNMMIFHGGGQQGSSAALEQAIQSILTQSGAVWMRTSAWLAVSVTGKGVSVNDPVMRILMWSVLLWGLALWGGWATGRSKVLVGLVPALAVLAAVTKYADADITPLWLVLACTLGLLSLIGLDANLRHWNNGKVDYSEMISGNTLWSALAVITVLVSLGWAISSISVHDLLEAYRRQQAENKLATSLGLEAARQTAVPTNSGLDYVRPPGLPTHHLLGSGPELSQDVVFSVRTGELPQRPVARLGQSVPRHYWRSYTFDMYSGSGWFSSRAERLSYQAEQALYDIPAGYRVLKQVFSLRHGEEGSLYWTGALYRSNLPMDGVWRTPPGQSYPQAVDAFRGADLYGALNSAPDYQVEGLVRDVSVEELRAAGRDFPDFIRQRYTALPASVPERVYALARQVTQAAGTPYDEARALELYLRKNYVYSLDVPLPPANSDVADNFLFALQRGYCDYYATAMVVMARSVGLPARLVMGFSTGRYQAAAAEYVVTAADAHAWVEVYFSGVGWVEFEPTSAQPEIIRPMQAVAAAQTAPIAPPQWDKIVRSLYSFPVLTRQVFLGLGWLLVLGFVFLLMEGWLLGFVNPNLALRWMVRGVYRQGRRLVGEPIPGQTTSEFVERLQLAFDRRDARLDVLMGLYLQGLFGPRAVQKAGLREAIRAWRGLRWRLFWTVKRSADGKRPGKSSPDR